MTRVLGARLPIGILPMTESWLCPIHEHYSNNSFQSGSMPQSGPDPLPFEKEITICRRGLRCRSVQLLEVVPRQPSSLRKGLLLSLTSSSLMVV